MKLCNDCEGSSKARPGQAGSQRSDARHHDRSPARGHSSLGGIRAKVRFSLDDAFRWADSGASRSALL